MAYLIELSAVGYRYQENAALSDINLALSSGESLVLAGANGCGKSSLLRLLAGVIHAQSGSYLYDGKEISAKSLKNPSFSKGFHKRVGLVFQNSEAQLFCTNVYEEIAFGPRQMQMDEEEVKGRVNDCLELLAIPHLKHREPFHLSQGEKKKVALAAVLSLNPDTLLLDEPLDGLDPKTKRFLKELLLKLKAAGKTLICATHEFESIDGVFDRMAVINTEHQVARTGSFAEIMADHAFLAAHNLR